MARTRKLTVEIAGDAKGLSSAIGSADQKVGGLGSKFSALSGKAKLALAGAATTVVAFAKSSVDAYVEAEQAQSRLSDAYARFPQLAGGNIDALRKLNTELAKKTKFDDDATASAQAVLAQFGLTQKQLEAATPLLQDYAAKTGKDLPTAAKDFGKALIGQGRAFKQVGLNLKDLKDPAKNFEQLMGGLNDKVGGFAEKQGKTAAGQAEILKNQFGELQETVGSKLVPALLVLATFVSTKVIPAFQRVGGFIADNKELFIALGIGITAALVPAFIAWATAAASAAAATLAAAAPVIAIGAAIAALAAGVIYAYQHWGWFRDVVKKVAAFLTDTLWPALQSVAGFVTGTLVPAVAGVIGMFVKWGQKAGEIAGKIIGYVSGVISWARTNWPLILAILTGPIGLAVLAISRHWDRIKAGATAVKDWVVGRFNEMVSFFAGLPGRISSFASGIWNALKTGLAAAVKWILEQLDRLLGPLDEIAGKVGGVIGKAGGVLGSIPGFASGVTNFRGGLAWVGEHGAELVRLPAGSDVIPNHAISTGGALTAGGGDTYLTAVLTLDGEVVGRRMIRFDADHRARNGRGAFSG